MDIRKKIKEKLSEAEVEFSKIGPEHMGGFCTYNPKISSYALENKDQLAETLIFVIATQQSDWPTVVAQFPYIIAKLEVDNTLYDKKGRFNSDMGYYKLIGYMGRRKIDPINFIWQNRDAIYQMTKSILKKWSYHELSAEAEEASFNLFRYFMTLPQLSYAKAGFAVQMVTGRLGCYDSVNANIYPIPAKQKKVLINKQGRFRPLPKSEAGQQERLRAYVSFLNQLKTNADSPYNQELWDRWTHVIAQKINLAGSNEPIDILNKGKKVATVKAYKALAKSNPDIKAFMDKHQGKMTGDDVSKQHYIPNLKEVNASGHFFERVKQRIHGLSDDISRGEMANILRNIESLKETEFPKGSFAIRLGNFRPDPESPLYVSVGRDGRGYYRIMDDEVLTDSTGDEIWAVVRDNTVTTIMLRKRIQTKDITHNNDKMDVDNSIYNLQKFLKSKKEKEQKKSEKPKALVLKINGVKWQVDPEKEIIFKKNKPEVKMDLIDVLDKLDEPTQEKILSLV